MSSQDNGQAKLHLPRENHWEEGCITERQESRAGGFCSQEAKAIKLGERSLPWTRKPPRWKQGLVSTISRLFYEPARLPET